MKKKLFSILALMCLIVTGAWAESFTITFKSASGTSDSSTKVYTVDAIVEDGATYVSSVTADNIYNAKSGYGLKFGTSSKIGTLTLTLANEVKNVTSIVVNARQYGSGTETTLKIQDKGDYTTTTEFTDYTYTYDTPATVSTITLATTTKRTYIKSVTVNYTASQGGDLSDEEFDLTVGTGEIIFTVNDEEVEKAKEGDVVTVTVVSDDEHVAAEVTGLWYAAIAASRIASTGTSVELLTDIEFTPVEDTYNQWTFVMQRANAEVSASYWDINDLIELIRKEMNTAVVFLATYGSQMVESDIVPIVLACNEAYDLLERHDNGVDIPLDEALEVYMKLKKLNGMDYGVTTGIGNVNVNVNVNGYYDLSGRRVAQPTKGIYILNGKKMMVK